jgi:hypothetical protein
MAAATSAAGTMTIFQVEQQYRPVERRLRFDETAQDAQAVVGIGFVVNGGFVQLRLIRNRLPASRPLGAQPGNRHVERDAIQPRGKTPLRIEGAVGAPGLRGDFLREVFHVRAAAAVAAGDAVHQALVFAQQRDEFSAGFRGHVGGLLHVPL